MSINIIYIVAGDSRSEGGVGRFFKQVFSHRGGFPVRVRARSMFFKLSYCKLPVVYIYDMQ